MGKEKITNTDNNIPTLFYIHMTNREGFPSGNPLGGFPVIRMVDHNILYQPKEKKGVDITSIIMYREIKNILSEYCIRAHNIPHDFLLQKAADLARQFSANLMPQLDNSHYSRLEENLEILPNFRILNLNRKQVREMQDFLSEKRKPLNAEDKEGIISGPYCECFDYSIYYGEEYSPVIKAMDNLRLASSLPFTRLKEKAMNKLERACVKAKLIS